VTRVCRVAPDVTAVERVFDYTVPEHLDAIVRVGSIVRVPLHGRRVRGWVVADHVASDVEGLLPILAVASDGPSPDVVALTEWVARRWCGPRVAVLRSASPPNRVAPGAGARAGPAGPGFTATVVRHPPLRDRRTLVEGMLAPTGSTIVVVADGGRAGSLARTLRTAGHNVALVHSDESDAQRTDAWRRAALGGCVVVGGRIAVFAPVPDLAAAIVVDDADEALQEERVPTWHARDVLFERAQRAQASFAVLSPAPTVEAAALADGAVDALPHDVEVSGWPRARVVDRREEPPGARLLTEPLAAALRDARGLAVCVVNRRGRFRLLACDACHALLRWDRTDERPRICDQCGGQRLRVLRAGITRIREELEALIPGRRVIDVDTDTGDLAPADILIGTEAVLHRSDVRRARPVLVAFLDLDQELFAPRYRAATQAHWLVTRGAQLLSGRPRAETQLLVQTRVPDHEVARAVATGNPQLVAAAETERRRVLGYPPFGAIAELTGPDAALTVAADALRSLSVTVHGPTGGRALVRAPDWESLADPLAAAVRAARASAPGTRVRVAVDPPRI